LFYYKDSYPSMGEDKGKGEDNYLCV